MKGNSVDSSGARSSPTPTSPQQQAARASSISRRNVVLLMLTATLAALLLLGPQFGFSPFELWFGDNQLRNKNWDGAFLNSDSFPIAQTQTQVEETAYVFIAIGAGRNWV